MTNKIIHLNKRQIVPPKTVKDWQGASAEIATMFATTTAQNFHAMLTDAMNLVPDPLKSSETHTKQFNLMADAFVMALASTLSSMVKATESEPLEKAVLQQLALKFQDIRNQRVRKGLLET